MDVVRATALMLWSAGRYVLAMVPPPATAPMEWPKAPVRLKSAVFRAGCGEMSFLTASGVASWSCAKGLAHSSVGQLSGHGDEAFADHRGQDRHAASGDVGEGPADAGAVGEGQHRELLVRRLRSGPEDGRRVRLALSEAWHVRDLPVVHRGRRWRQAVGRPSRFEADSSSPETPGSSRAAPGVPGLCPRAQGPRARSPWRRQKATRKAILASRRWLRALTVTAATVRCV